MNRSFENVRYWGLALLIGCGVSGTEVDRIEVREANELRITAIEANHFDDDGDKVFELRGVDASGDERGLVRLRTGVINDIGKWLPGDSNVGSEIAISVNGHDTRMVTRELRRFELSQVDDIATQQFLELAAVSSTLEREVNVIVAHATSEHRDDAKIEGEVALGAASCPAGYVLTSPVAKGCCYGTQSAWGTAVSTLFVRPDGQVVNRARNPQNPFGAPPGCKASDGVSACNGASCYFGPAGFAAPILTVPPAGYYAAILRGYSNNSGNYYCYIQYYSTQRAGTFGDVTGTFPRGQGCPGGGTGAGLWDY
jgi:hypothetical protein